MAEADCAEESSPSHNAVKHARIQKVVSKPVKVEFYTKTGESVKFNARHTFSKPVKVDFLKKEKM